MKPKTMTVKYKQVDPKVIWLDVDGVHFPLSKEIAFVYNWSRAINGEEMTNDLLRPQIMSARAAWIAETKAATAPQQVTAQTL